MEPTSLDPTTIEPITQPDALDEALRAATSDAPPEPAPTPGTPPKPRSLWRNRDYMLLWSGQTVSAVGTGISGIAFPFLVLYLTHSPAQAGLAGALRALPYLFLSLPVGALIDRWNRKLVMILCDTGRALALGSIPVAFALGRLTIGQILIVAFVEGTLFVFFDIAEVACLPRVVPKAQLPAATGQNQATFGIAFLVAPAIGGALFTIDKLLPFLSDAVSYLASVGSLFLIRTPFQGERTAQRRNLGAEIAEGIAWLWRQPLIRFMAFLTGGLNFVFSASALIIILLAQRQGASPVVIGAIFSLSSIGGIIGAIIGGSIQKRFTFTQVIIVTGWIQALLWPLVLIAPNAVTLGVLAGAIFMVAPIYNIVQFSYRLSLIPDALQGRVNSVFRLLAYGFQPIGLAVGGFLLQQVSTGPTVLAFGAVLLALAVTTTFNRHVRQAGAARG